MPFFANGQDPRDTLGAPTPERSPLGAPEVDPFAPQPHLADVTAAAFRQNNPIVSVIESIANRSDETRVDPTHNPLDLAKGTPLEQDPSALIDSPNAATTRAIIAQRQGEDRDRATLARGGWTGTIAGLSAGLIDPSYYLPIFGELHAAEGAASLGRSALRAAATGAGQSAVSEGALSATQQRRTFAESAGNIATNTLLMGALGGALGTLARPERAEALAGLEAVRRDSTPVDPLDPASMSLHDHITPGESGFSQGLERRAAALRDAGAAPTPIEAAEAAHIEALPPEIADAAYGPTAQSGIRDAAERGGQGGEPDPAGALGEPGGGWGADGGDGGGGTEVDAAGSNSARPDSDGVIARPDDNLLARVTADGAGHGRNRLVDLLAEDARAAGLAPSAAGADVSDVRDLQPKTYGLNTTRGIRKVANAVSPNQRVYNNSESLTARRAMADSAETATRFTMHDQGVPTAAGGAPIETLVRQDKAKFMTAAHDVLERAWSDHRYGDVKPGLLQQATDRAREFRGNVPAGKLTYKAFKGEVYDAMTAGDTHPIAQVQQAARDMRAQVFEPIAKMARGDAGTGRQADARRGAVRAGRRPKFRAARLEQGGGDPKRYQLRQIITDWLQGEQATKAAAKDRVGDLQERHEALGASIDTLDRRLDAIKAKQGETETRLSERGQEARATEGRSDTIADRAGIVKQGLSELDEFISSMRAEVRDPAQRARLDDLQREANDLRREAAPMSAAELKRLERGEVADVLPGDLRKAAEVYLGKRRLPDAPSFVSSLIKDGGIKDTGGDIRHMLGGTRARPGLLNTRGRSLDQIGEDLYGSFSHVFPERPSVADVQTWSRTRIAGMIPPGGSITSSRRIARPVGSGRCRACWRISSAKAATSRRRCARWRKP